MLFQPEARLFFDLKMARRISLNVGGFGIDGQIGPAVNRLCRENRAVISGRKIESCLKVLLPAP